MIRKNYHWIIAAVISIEMILFGGILNAYSVFMIPISQSLNISRATYALANIPYNLFSFISTMLTAVFYRKFGYKRFTIISLVITVVALLGLSSCTELWQYVFFRILFAAGYGSCFTAGCVWIIKIWFHKHQGVLLGFTSMCTGLGGSLMTKVLSYIITVYNWRVALQATALAFIPIIFLFLLIRDNPQDMGLRPYGEFQFSHKRKNILTEWSGFSLRELTKRLSFYLMLINTFLCVVALYMTSPMLVSYLCDSGYTKIEASSFHAVMFISLAVAKLAGGWISDKFGAKSLPYIFIGFTALAQFLLLDVSNPAITYIATVLLGIGASSATVMIPLLTTPIFGYRGSAEINGIMIAIPSLSNMISDTTANAIYDATGSYRTYFPVLIIVNVLLLVSYTILFISGKKDRQDYQRLYNNDTISS